MNPSGDKQNQHWSHERKNLGSSEPLSVLLQQEAIRGGRLARSHGGHAIRSSICSSPSFMLASPRSIPLPQQEPLRSPRLLGPNHSGHSIRSGIFSSSSFVYGRKAGAFPRQTIEMRDSSGSMITV